MKKITFLPIDKTINVFAKTHDLLDMPEIFHNLHKTI